jgi:hypothetical protein
MRENSATHLPQSTVPLPVGAAGPSDWQIDEGVINRPVWSQPMTLPDHLSYDIRVVVTLLVDGSLVNEPGDAPLVYMGCEDYSPEDARTLAQAILLAADLAEGWVAR